MSMKCYSFFKINSDFKLQQRNRIDYYSHRCGMDGRTMFIDFVRVLYKLCILDDIPESQMSERLNKGNYLNKYTNVMTFSHANRCRHCIASNRLQVRVIQC